jgi:hypothetical protein
MFVCLSLQTALFVAGEYVVVTRPTSFIHMLQFFVDVGIEVDQETRLSVGE